MNVDAKGIYQDNETGFFPIRVEKYKPEYKEIWDNFVDRSKNGTFLFYRDYMEYHSDRFQDYSLMFLKGNKLVAVMPANIENNTVISHGGLTYGGIITGKKMRTYMMLDIFDSLIYFLKSNDVTKLVYKTIPHIYHSIPAEEDIYALFRNNAKLIRRDISSTIFLREKVNYNKSGRWAVNKSKKNDFKVQRDYDFRNFMVLKEKDLMKKYNLKPVHTHEEMELLAERFPDNIKLFTVKEKDEILAGLVVYETKNVAHAQYLSSNGRGKELFVAEFLLNYLIKDYYKDKYYFDFGISTEDNGYYLNTELIRFKEKFGARGITYDFYEIYM
jgi:hypothetical protein